MTPFSIIPFNWRASSVGRSAKPTCSISSDACGFLHVDAGETQMHFGPECVSKYIRFRMILFQTAAVRVSRAYFSKVWGK